MDSSQNIAERIKIRAKLKGISVSKLLEICELNKNTIYTMQSSGFLPRLETIAKIADYLDCSVDYLIGRTENSYPINQVNTGNVGDNSNVNINKSSSAETDEMTKELVKAFNSLPFLEKLEILNLVIKKRDDIL